MLSILTRYLVQFKRVCIPHVGTFQLVQESPEIDVASKICLAPYFTTRLLQVDSIPEHQLSYLASQGDPAQAKEELNVFGQTLQKRIQEHPFRWNGFGTLKYDAGRIVLEPVILNPAGWEAVPANKVLRQDALHQLLVGDRETDSGRMSAELETSPQMPLWMLVAWILLALSIIAIIVVLWLGKFEVEAAGLRLHY